MMFRPERLQLVCAAIAGLAFGGLGYAQTSAPTNTLHNPYRDREGNIYGAEVGPKRLMKYVRN
ncbi:MAG: hypothetical protein ACJ8E1_16255 [Xanthobacteraceae bacterium]